MKSFKLLALIALVVSLGTVNAKAMGQREAGALWGLVGGIVIYNLIDNSRNVRIHPVPRVETTYVTRYEPEHVTYYRPSHYVEKVIVIDKRYNHRRRHNRREYRDYDRRH